MFKILCTRKVAVPWEKGWDDAEQQKWIDLHGGEHQTKRITAITASCNLIGLFRCKECKHEWARVCSSLDNCPNCTRLGSSAGPCLLPHLQAECQLVTKYNNANEKSKIEDEIRGLKAEKSDQGWQTFKKTAANLKYTAENVPPRSTWWVIWKCPACNRLYPSPASNRSGGSGCSHCARGGWPVEKIRELVRSLLMDEYGDIVKLSGAELHAIFSTHGVDKCRTPVARLLPLLSKVPANHVKRWLNKQDDNMIETAVIEGKGSKERLEAALSAYNEKRGLMADEDEDNLDAQSDLTENTPVVFWESTYAEPVNAMIKEVHNEDPPTYYTIRLESGDQVPSVRSKLTLHDAAHSKDPALPPNKVPRIFGQMRRLDGKVPADSTVAEFLVSKGIDRLWQTMFAAERDGANLTSILDDASNASLDSNEHSYVHKTRATFVDECRRTLELQGKLAKGELGYSFQDESNRLHVPYLAQVLLAIRLASPKHSTGLGNWSDVGTGKTLSAILADRFMFHEAKKAASTRGAQFDNQQVTLVLCPNSVSLQWAEKTSLYFPNVYEIVVINSSTKQTSKGFRIENNLPECGKALAWNTRRPQLVIINYDKLSDPKKSEERMRSLLKSFDNRLGLVILDEIHAVKVRGGKVVPSPVAGDDNDEPTDIEGACGVELEAVIERQDPTSSDVVPIRRQTSDDTKHLSTRRKNVEVFVHDARTARRLEPLRVLGLTATPVVNELEEAISLLEMVSGKSFRDSGTANQNSINLTPRCRQKPTIDECMAVHQALIQHGLRFKSSHGVKLHVHRFEGKENGIDDDGYTDFFIKNVRSKIAAKKIENKRSDGGLARTKAKMGAIRQICLKYHAKKMPVIVYTHIYKNGILDVLKNGLQQVPGVDLRVETYTGEQPVQSREDVKSRFIKGEIDVLIGSQAICTGVDGLQEACCCMVINLLPMTHGEWEQLKGRLFRAGQKGVVEVFILVTRLLRGRSTQSEDEVDWIRIQSKSSIADAVIDGELPSGKRQLIESLSRESVEARLKMWLDAIDAEGATVAEPTELVPRAGANSNPLALPVSGASEGPANGSANASTVNTDTSQMPTNIDKCDAGAHSNGHYDSTEPLTDGNDKSVASRKRTSEATKEANKRRKLEESDAHEKVIFEREPELCTLFSYLLPNQQPETLYSTQMLQKLVRCTGQQPSEEAVKDWESKLSESDCVVAATGNSKEHRKISDVIEDMRGSQLEYLGYRYWYNLQIQLEEQPKKDPDSTKAYQDAVEFIQSNDTNRYILEADEQRNVLRSDRREWVMQQLKRCIRPCNKTGMSKLKELSAVSET